MLRTALAVVLALGVVVPLAVEIIGVETWRAAWEAPIT